MTQKRVKASDVIGNSYYIYTLESSNNTPALNGTINITCNVTNVYGQAVSGKSITLYQNSTSKGAKTTDSNGNASWNSISMSSAGLQVFKVENSKIEVFVDNKSDVGHTHSQYLTEHQSLSNYVTTDDSRLSDSRTPTSHTHGNLQNNGQVGSTAQANKNVVTNSSGLITTEDKPTIPSASSTTPSADTTNGSVGTGTTWARSNHTHPKSSLYAEATHNHTKSQITDFPSIPSKTSDLQNDSGFLTSHQDISGKLDKAQTSYKGKNVVVDSSSGNITFEEKNNHTHSNYLTSTDISGKIDTAGSGLSKSGTTLNHSNSITALTTASFKKVKYDSQGHITGTSDVSASDLPTHTHSQYLTEHQDLSDYVTTDDSRLSDARTPKSHTHTKSQITDFPNLGAVALSNDYDDLDNKPTNITDLDAQTNMGYKIFDYDDNNQEISFADSLVFDGSDIYYNGYTIATLGDIPNVTGKEDKSNKVTSISSSSTDTQYPSAKLVYDKLEPKLAKSDTKTLDSQYMAYGIYNSWEIVEVFGGQEMADQVNILDDAIDYQNFEGLLKFTNNTPKRLLLNLTLAIGNSSEHYYSFDRENYIDLSSTTTTITLESDEFVYLYCDSGNSVVTYSVRSDKNSIGTIVDMIYPVGSIYMNVNPTDPQILFGGTWTRLKDRFLLSAGDTYTNGSTGGSADATLVSHQHGTSNSGEYFVTSESDGANNTRVSYNASGNRYVDGMTSNSTPFHHRVGTGYVGSSGTGKNMPPYLTVYMWKRIA